MRIGINANLLSCSDTYRATGLSNYIHHLLHNLGVIDQNNRYSVYVSRSECRTDFQRQSSMGNNFRFCRTWLPTHQPSMRLFWEQVVPPTLSHELDVFHSPVNVIPLMAHVPHVLTVHDLAFMIYKDRHLPSKRRYLTFMTKLSVRRARYILTVSENTRQDVIRLLGVPPEKVITVPLGVDEHYQWHGGTSHGRTAIEDFRSQKGLPERFFLYLGTLEPRKNIPQLLQAYADFRAQSQGKLCREDIPKLVLAGPKGWMYTQIFEQVKNLGLKEEVLFPGFVPRDEVSWWYNAALGFVYLSAYEGFGLPPLQAMASGVPVIVNNTSSLPEVVGDAGMLVSAKATEEVCAAFMAISSSAEVREQLRVRGLERASQFSWRQTAERTLRVYEAAQSPIMPNEWVTLKVSNKNA